MSKRRRMEPDSTAGNSNHHGGDYSRATDTFSKLDEATLSYYKEIRAHLNGLTDEEQRSMLAANALEETKGKEAEVAGDKVCSRVLEVLLAAAPPEAVEKFAAGALAAESFVTLASSPNGSHVAERLCETLMASGTERSYQILVSASKVVADKLYEFATDRFGSHVARRLISLAGGIDSQGVLGAHSAGNAAQQGAQGLAGKVGLQNKADAGGASGDDGLLEAISAALLGEGFAKPLAEELPYHQYGGAFLQTALLAHRGKAPFLDQFIPRMFGVVPGEVEGNTFAAVSSEDFHAMLQERTSSHLMEVIASVAPEGMREQIYDRFYKNHLAFLAMHPVANFVVQAVLATINKSPQMKAAIKELRGSFPTLLRSKRGGVVAAALAAAGRTSTGQVDLGKALGAALRELPGNQQGLAAALLTLDLGAKMEGLDVRKRLSTLGCSMLVALFSYIKEASTEYLDSFLNLSPKELARVGADPGGSRVMEALIEGPCTAKFKKKLLKKLQGYYATAASTPGGNFLVEKCYTYAGLKEKEVIAEELARAESQLSSTPRGMKLLLRCRVAEFKRNSAKWRNQVQAADALKQEFAEIFADAPTPRREAGTEAAHTDKEGPRKKRKRREASVPAAGSEEVGTKEVPNLTASSAEATGKSAEEPPKKKKKKKSGGVAVEVTDPQPASGALADAEGAAHEPHKRRKGRVEAHGLQNNLDTMQSPAEADNGSAQHRELQKGKKKKGRAGEAAKATDEATAAQILDTGSGEAGEPAQGGGKKKRKAREVEAAEVVPSGGADGDVQDDADVLDVSKNKKKKKKARASKVAQEDTQQPAAPDDRQGGPPSEPPRHEATHEVPAGGLAESVAKSATRSASKKRKAKPTEQPVEGAVGGVAESVGPRGVLQGGGQEGGDATIMESLTVDGVLTKLEVFEDKVAVPSALVRSAGSEVSKVEKQKKQGGRAGGEKRGERGGKGRGKQVFGDGIGRRGRKRGSG